MARPVTRRSVEITMGKVMFGALVPALFAMACATSHPVAGAPLDVQVTTESLVQAAALAEVSRAVSYNDTLWVQSTTRQLFDNDSAATVWADSMKAVMQRVPAQLLSAYAHANTEEGDVVLPDGIRGHKVARPRVAPALASRAVQIFTLTRPGFTLSGDTAFMLVTRSCGGLCGRIDGLLLSHDAKNRWRVVSTPWWAIRGTTEGSIHEQHPGLIPYHGP